MHFHFGSEDNIIEDFITRDNNEPEDNLRSFMTWVRKQLKLRLGLN